MTPLCTLQLANPAHAARHMCDAVAPVCGRCRALTLQHGWTSTSGTMMRCVPYICKHCCRYSATAAGSPAPGAPATPMPSWHILLSPCSSLCQAREAESTPNRCAMPPDPSSIMPRTTVVLDSPKVTLISDIQGAEFPVFAHLADSGLAGRIDIVSTAFGTFMPADQACQCQRRARVTFMLWAQLF